MPAGGVRGVEDLFVAGLKKAVPQGGTDKSGDFRAPIIGKAETMDTAGETAADVRDAMMPRSKEIIRSASA